MLIKSLVDLKKSNNKWGLLIGPEGGFSDEEKNLLNNKNVITVSLGSRVLDLTQPQLLPYIVFKNYYFNYLKHIRINL